MQKQIPLDMKSNLKKKQEFLVLKKYPTCYRLIIATKLNFIKPAISDSLKILKLF